MGYRKGVNGMKKGAIVALSIVGAIVLLIIILVSSGINAYNGLVDAETKVSESASNIETQLQRRADLIPNLVETVKGYAKHEEDIYTAIADARSKLVGAGTLEEKGAANAELSSALSRLLVVVENYPNLKANENFIALQSQLEGTENRIAVTRKDYNEAVADYNKRIRRFPSSIIAGMFGFEKVGYFEGAEGVESAPNVSFS